MNEHELVEALCKAHGSIIENVFFESVAHFYERHRDELLDIRSASKATLINDYIYKFLKRDLRDAGRFEFMERGNGRYIGYDSKILIRIKKLSRSKKPAVNKTIASTRFNTQADLGLIENAKNVYLGYVLNSESGNVDEIAFAYPNAAGAIAWTINVVDRHIQQTLDRNVVPFEFDSDEGKPRKDRLRSRVQRRKQNKQ